MRLGRLALLLPIALTGCAAAVGTSGAAPHGAAVTRVSAARQNAGTSEALARLAQRVALPIPARNLYDLTAELKHPDQAIPRIVSHTSPRYRIGHGATFYVGSEDQNRFFQMHATIVAETPHLYIYLQDGVKLNVSQAQAAANVFERSIYPTDRAHFGSEWRPGVDGDPHIICLVGNLQSSGAAGFYSADDEYPHVVNPYSNEHEMIYINSSDMLPGSVYFNQTIAHEFQHMIHWHMHPHDNAWLNEGMSMLAEKLNGMPDGYEVGAFESQPDTQLNAWSLSSRVDAHYGGAYLFLSYLYERFGSRFIREMLADKQYTDLPLVDDVLHKLHIATTADTLFDEWTVANELRDRAVGGGKYSYPEIAGALTLNRQGGLPLTHSGRMPPYAAQYVAIDKPAGAFTLRFSAAPTVPLLALVPSGGFWWSNRGDMSNTWMARTVNLTHARHATLEFQTAYDIEKDFDYAYVEASSDGGKTWKTLRGTSTTATNPNGANFGNAYTGTTKGWRAETVNLSRYAGRTIQIRFEYVTDDEENGEGMVVRHIRIPAIRYTDNSMGWKTQGWVWVQWNALPNTWHVQAIVDGAATPRVIAMHVAPSTGKGSLRIAAGATRVVVVISSAAPKTTVESSYTLSSAR